MSHPFPLARTQKGVAELTCIFTQRIVSGGGSALIQTAADIFLHVHVQQQLKTWRTGPAIQVQFPSELIYVFCSLIRVSLATGLEKNILTSEP